MEESLRLMLKNLSLNQKEQSQHLKFKFKHPKLDNSKTCNFQTLERLLQRDYHTQNKTFPIIT